MIELIKNAPYKLLWSIIPIICIAALLVDNKEVDLQLHDTYIVMLPIHIALVLSILIGLIGLVYWLMRNKQLVGWVTIFHIAITIAVILLIIFHIFFISNIVDGNIDYLETIHQSILGLVLILIMCQLLFLANIGIGLVRNPPK